MFAPSFHASIVTYLDNLPQAHATLAAFRASDWGSEPAVFVQPPHWPKGRLSASAIYKRALVAAEASGADFALVLEDDVRVCRHLRHNLGTIPVVARRIRGCAERLFSFISRVNPLVPARANPCFSRPQA